MKTELDDAKHIIKKKVKVWIGDQLYVCNKLPTQKDIARHMKLLQKRLK